MPGLDIVPSNIDLSAAEVQLVTEVAREQVLTRALAPAVAEYDFVIIDCQPSLGLLTVNALTAANGVIVPMEAEFFALRGVAMLVETIQKVQDRLNPGLEIDGLVATMFDSRTVHSREVLARLVEAFDEKVFHTAIARTVRFPETTVAGEPITTFATVLGRRLLLPAAGQGGARTVPGHVTGVVAGESGGLGEPADDTEPTEPRSRRRRPGPPAQTGGRRARPAASATTRRSPSTSPRTSWSRIEQARLVLRAEHGVAVDRGRLVREAVAEMLIDLEAHGEDSVVVSRLRPAP